MFQLPDHPYIDARYDNLFKQLITAEWCVESDGNVEAPTGYFSVTEIPAHEGELKEMCEAVFGDDQDSEYYFLPNWPEPGWYVTHENDQGLIFVWKMRNKTHAVTTFRSWQREFVKWDSGEGVPF